LCRFRRNNYQQQKSSTWEIKLNTLNAQVTSPNIS
jgi:hypothetical protein